MQSRTERLNAIRNRWNTEPLSVQFPSLGVALTEPATCAEYVASERIITADQADNLNHFGADDPKAILTGLNGLFDAAITGKIDPRALKSAATILATLHSDAAALAKHYAPQSKSGDDTLYASHVADMKATEQCLTVVSELAAELGITLPIANPGQQRQ